ncbi:MAG TPA: hypothetical protein VN639_11230 [Azonexus sp.]|nr:hypothetical protein [Azonexus sp.]
MADIPEDDLEETRAALAPTLEATAAILPWLAKPRPPRFDRALNQRWIEAGGRLAAAWSNRHSQGTDDIRPAIFALYGVALETADAGCLRLGEALASAADQLERSDLPPRLIAALSACIECLIEPGGLEHEAFASRVEHFAQRLEAALAPHSGVSERSPVLDHLFAEEAREHIEQMRDALLVLPPDAYALKSEAAQIAQQAEHLELYGIMHQAHQLAGIVNGALDLDNPEMRHGIEERLNDLAAAIAAVHA